MRTWFGVAQLVAHDLGLGVRLGRPSGILAAALCDGISGWRQSTLAGPTLHGIPSPLKLASLCSPPLKVQCPPAPGRGSLLYHLAKFPVGRTAIFVGWLIAYHLSAAVFSSRAFSPSVLSRVVVVYCCSGAGSVLRLLWCMQCSEFSKQSTQSEIVIHVTVPRLHCSSLNLSLYSKQFGAQKQRFLCEFFLQQLLTTHDCQFTRDRK